MRILTHVLKYELKAAIASKNLFLVSGFFVVVMLTTAISLGQYGVAQKDYSVAMLWITLAFSSLLSIRTIFENDSTDGTLDFIMHASISLESVIVSKALVHWITTSLPIILLTPIVCIFLGLNLNSTAWIALVMIIGTPGISFISTIGAALTLGENTGQFLISILMLPTFLPILLFGIKISLLATNGVYDNKATLVMIGLTTGCLAITPLITGMIVRVHYN